MLLNTTAFPKRVYQPARGWFGTALRQESVGVLVRIDPDQARLLEWGLSDEMDPAGPVVYVPESVLVEVESTKDHADGTHESRLVDGRIVLWSSVELAPEVEDL